MRTAFVVLLVFVASAASPLSVSSDVMASPGLSVLDRASFLTSTNPSVDLGTSLNYSLLYEEEGTLEGVNPDLAFAQMLLETSFLKFPGQVRRNQNNFAGLGALDGGDRGLVFSSPRLGIRAQIQHLKYYATTDQPLKGAPINPRLGYVKRGSATNAWSLAKTWASDPDYGNKLMALVARMVAYAERSQTASRSAAPAVAPARLAGD
jgi:hypothetical protein